MSHVQESPAIKRTMASRLGDLLLTVLAVGGSICLILVILGIVFNISIMMFRTGSMSPTITTGSIAFVREIPATQMSVGDVVTVERGENILPVTHRVLEIVETNDNGVVTFTMQGDANESPDVEPYSVSEVKTLMFSIPKVAPAIQWFSNPWVLGGLTVGASLIVVWAFWPRDDDDPQPSLQAPSTHLSLMLPAAFLAVAIVGAPASQLEDITNTSSGEILRMAASGDPKKMQQLSPGRSANWTVDIWADAPEDQAITVDLSFDARSTDAEFPLLVSLTECSVELHEPIGSGCPSNSALLVDNILLQVLQDRRKVPLSEFGSDEKRRVIVTGALARTTEAIHQDGTVSIKLIATGAGEEISISPDGPLPDSEDQDRDQNSLPPTGFNGWQWLVAVGLVTIAAGITLRKRRRPDSNGE